MNRGERIEVRSSPISGRGVFAVTPIKRDEVVIAWQPRGKLSAAEFARFGASQAEEKHYVTLAADGSYLVMGEPERFVNHSCDPNTAVRDNADIALRDIVVGEEITSDYGCDGTVIGFQCSCGSPACRGWIGPVPRNEDEVSESRGCT